MDAEYLRQNIGNCLSECLAEVCMKRPADPIEYIAHWLYKHIDNVNAKTQVITELFLFETEDIIIWNILTVFITIAIHIND